MGRWFGIALAFVLALLPGCSDDTSSPVDCPAAKPDDAVVCTTASSKTCSYLLSKSCSCGKAREAAWRCGCAQGKWKCTEDADVCIPCKKDQGPDGLAKVEAGKKEGGADSAKKGCVPACKSDEVCVQSFDGTCKTSGPGCKKVSASCLTSGCTALCEKELCSSPYQCQTPAPCGTEQGATINCYGP